MKKGKLTNIIERIPSFYDMSENDGANQKKNRQKVAC